MDLARSIPLFVAAAVLEIGGAWLVWQGIRDHRGWLWIGAGVVALGLYGVVATLQPDAQFGRILAAYGGVFVAGSLIAGLAISIPMMMVARVVQGIAMGGLMALVQSIMGAIISPRERGRYAGLMGGVMGIATVSGPLLGGEPAGHVEHFADGGCRLRPLGVLGPLQRARHATRDVPQLRGREHQRRLRALDPAHLGALERRLQRLG